MCAVVRLPQLGFDPRACSRHLNTAAETGEAGERGQVGETNAVDDALEGLGQVNLRHVQDGQVKLIGTQRILRSIDQRRQWLDEGSQGALGGRDLGADGFLDLRSQVLGGGVEGRLQVGDDLDGGGEGVADLVGPVLGEGLDDAGDTADGVGGDRDDGGGGLLEAGGDG